MALRPDVTLLPPLDPVGDPTSLNQCWKTWKKRFETYLIALNITEDEQKRALLLYQAGQAIFETLTETGEDYKTALAKLDEYFLPKKNVDYKTFQFQQATKKSDETVYQFVTRLRKLAKHCKFTDLSRDLKLAVIQNCTSKCLRRYALRKEDMTLDKIMAKAQALENREKRAKGMEETAAQSTANPSESVRHVQRSQRPPRSSQHPPRSTTQNCSQQRSSTQCHQCGLSWGKTCNKYGKPNHFAKN